MFTIKEVSLDDFLLVNEYKNEFLLSNEEHIQGAAGLLQTDTLTWIKERSLYKNKDTLPNKNFVPAHTFIAVINNKMVGVINIRHELNDFLFNFGGHIGYSISPSERRKGYASLMLKQAIEFSITELGITRLLLTCDSENIASIKTIISCGGILENQIQEYNRLTNRYWIKN